VYAYVNKLDCQLQINAAFSSFELSAFIVSTHTNTSTNTHTWKWF